PRSATRGLRIHAQSLVSRTRRQHTAQQLLAARRDEDAVLGLLDDHPRDLAGEPPCGQRAAALRRLREETKQALDDPAVGQAAADHAPDLPAALDEDDLEDVHTQVYARRLLQ